MEETITKKKQPSIYRSVRHIHWTDSHYKMIYDYLNENIEPTFNFRSGLSRFKALYSQFSLVNNRITLVSNEYPSEALDKDGNRLYDITLPITLVVIKESEVEKILQKEFSSIATNGYRSTDTFYKKLCLNYIGISRKQVSEFIKKQEIHQMSLPSNNVILKPIVESKIMNLWECDLVDFRNLQHFNNGINFILNIIDVHSKFLWSVPIKNKSSALIASSLQQIFLNEGAPKELLSDNGSEFVNKDMDKLCNLFSIHQKHSLPYKPTTQGCVERVNGTLKKAITKYMHDNNTKKYITALPLLVNNYNTSKHSTTKFTPMQIHRGIDSTIRMNMFKAVHENIKKNAEKMVMNSMKKYKGQTDPLNVGDKVRLNVMALKDIRKLSAITKKARKVLNWSKEIYTVESISKDGNDIDTYFIVDSEGNYPETNEKGSKLRSFYRPDLMKINIDSEKVNEENEDENEDEDEKENEDDKIDYESKYENEDLFFGKEKELLEQHEVVLPKEVKEKAEIKQEDLDIIEEKKEEKEQKDLEKKLRKSTRQRKFPNKKYADFII